MVSTRIVARSGYDTPDRIGPEIDDMLSFMDKSTLVDEQVEEAAQPSVPLSEPEDDLVADVVPSKSAIHVTARGS
jgi:hypothetical protein